MKRRAFLAALAATFATPAQMLQPAKPVVLGMDYGFMPAGDYFAIVHPRLAKDLAAAGAMTDVLNHVMSGYVGTYESVRFIVSSEARA